MNSAARKTLALDQRERVTIYTAESPWRSVVFFDTPHEITVLVPLGYAETMYVLMQPSQLAQASQDGESAPWTDALRSAAASFSADDSLD